MTAARFIEDRKPGYRPTGPILPMTKEQAAFWRWFNERKERKNG